MVVTIFNRYLTGLKKADEKFLSPKHLMQMKVDSLLFSLIQKELRWAFIPIIKIILNTKKKTDLPVESEIPGYFRGQYVFINSLSF